LGLHRDISLEGEVEEKLKEEKYRMSNYKEYQKHIEYMIDNLESENKRLSEGIVLTNKISKLCANLEKRINLAIQKFGNVKEYADALNSFNDPDILSEINELTQLIADLNN
jgi:hypothetical protein